MAEPGTRARRHVLHVISGLGVGGAETTLLSLTTALAARGWESTVVALKDGEIADRLRGRGVPVTSLDLRGPGGAPQALWTIRRLAGEVDFDLVQGWMYHGNLAALAGAARARPVLWNVRHALHDVARERRGTRLVIRAGALLSSRPATIVYNSDASATQHARIGYEAGRAVVIPNGFDGDRMRPGPIAEARQALGLPPDVPVLGWIGRAHAIKGLDVFLQAAQAVGAQFPDVHLVLAGRGTAPAELAGRLERLGLAARARCLGEVADVAGVLAALDVFCLTSRSEAFPNVLAEAMLCGVPCVASDVGDVGRVLGDTGVAVPRADPAAAAAAVVALLREPAEDRRRRGLAGRLRIVRHYGLDRMADAYAALYERATRP